MLTELEIQLKKASLYFFSPWFLIATTGKDLSGVLKHTYVFEFL